MESDKMTLKVLASLYAEPGSLAAEEQQDLFDVLDKLVDSANRRRAWLRQVKALRAQIHQDGGLQIGETKEQVVG